MLVAFTKRMRWKIGSRLWSLLGVVALGACYSEAAPGATAIKTMDGLPGTSADVPSNLVVAESVTGISGASATVLFATESGKVFRAGSAGLGAELPLVFASDEPKRIGTVERMTPRGPDGMLLLASEGLFVDNGGAIVASPFREALRGQHVTSLSSVGQGADEALWYTTDVGAFVVRSGKQMSLTLGDKRIESIVGIDSHRALGFAAGTLVEIDVDANTDTLVMQGVGAPKLYARDVEGNVYTATTAGLLKRAVAGGYELRTLAPAGSPAPEVRALGAGADVAVLVVGDSVLMLKDGLAQRVGAAPAEVSQVAVDGIGDAWLAGKGGVQRFATGKRLSFAADVAPFMTAHCMTCHNGSSAPTRAFDTLEVSRAASQKIIKRLHGDGEPIMPPSNTEVLKPSDINVFVRWVQQGMPE